MRYVRASLSFAAVLAVAGGLALIWSKDRNEAMGLGGEEPMRATWKDASGVTHEVTTEQLDGEAPEDWAQRHSARVEALKAIYPPV